MNKNKSKKKSINLSELIKKYNIKDDVNINSEQYGIGGQIGAGIAGAAKGVAGTILPGPLGGAANQAIDGVHGALDDDITDEERSIMGYGQAAGAIAGTVATGGVAAPQGIATAADGIGQGIAYGSPDSESAQAIGQTISTAGQIGGMVQGNNGKIPLNTKKGYLAQGGSLTEYNGGGTHEENPNGGIDVGPNAQVEDKETRWQDYIFSDRINVPGKKYSFSEASKKINNKYNKRKNDSFDKKALEREMKGLMAMHEGERERMNLEHQNKMGEMFGCGGKMKHQDGGELKFITDPSQIAHRNREAEQLRVQQIQNAAHATGDYYMNPQQRGAAIKDKFSALEPNDMIPSLDKLGAESFGTTSKENDIAGKLKNTSKSTTTRVNGQLTSAEKEANLREAGTTPLTQTANINRLTPGEDTGEFPGYTPKYDKTGTKVIYDNDNPIYQEKISRNKAIEKFRQDIASQFKLPMNERGLADASQMDPNFTLSKKQLSQIDPEQLKGYYDNLRWKNKLRAREGWTRKNYYGDNEAEKMGYNSDTPLEDLNFGPRFITGVQNQQFDKVGSEQKAYGGKIKAQWGLDLSQLEAINQAQNPNIGALGAGANQQGIMRTPNNGEFYTTQQDYNTQQPNTNYTTQEGIDNSNLALDKYLNAGSTQLPNESQYTNAPEESKSKFGKVAGQAALFGAQNIGNIAGIIKGARGPEQVDLGQVNPRLVDYSTSIDNARRAYDSASNQAKESIRKTATSSGQALTNLIASNATNVKNKEQAMRTIQEQGANVNANILNRAEVANLDLRNTEADINAQNQAAADNAIMEGISGIGSNVAQFARDNKLDKQQQGYIENLINSGEYHIDPNTGKLMHTASNQPA